MAFGNREGGNYFSILNGKFSVRVQEGTPGAVSRVNKLGKQVWEIFHDSFTGKLVNIRVRDGEYGKSWNFDFKDGGEIYTLQLPYSNSSAVNLLKILPNADLAKEMKVQPSMKIEDNVKKTSIFVSQDGVTLKHAFTKDNPNGMPDLKKVVVSGKEVWDDTDRLAFLQKMVDEQILPKLPGRQEAQAAAAPHERALDVEAGAGGEDEDGF
jgi:hypothetical protein